MEEMTVVRMAPGLWRWTVPHPEWTPETRDWDRVVGCVYAETAEAVVLVDPLVPANRGDQKRFLEALDRDVERVGRPVAVMLTCRWHRRSAPELAERYGARVWAPTATGARIDGLVTDLVADGTEVMPGVVALVTGSPPPNEECVYVITGQRALVVGDILLGDAVGGIRWAPPDWYATSDAEREWYRRDAGPALARSLAWDLAFVLPAHGEPVTAAAADALRAALGPGVDSGDRTT